MAETDARAVRWGMDATPDQVTDNKPASRYELRVGGQVAFAEYRPAAGAIMFTHTEVPEGLEGQGVGSTLVRGALDDARAQGKMIIPMCPFVADFLHRHMEYVDLVQPEQRGVFGLPTD